MDAIPSFPHFVQLSLAHKDLLSIVTKRFPPYSDFNFVSLFTWDTDEKISVASLHGNLVVKFSAYENDELFLSFLGTKKADATIEVLLDYCKRHGFVTELRLIPHSVVEALPGVTLSRYQIVEDRDNHDYIVSTKNIANGGIARNKRRAYSHFIRELTDDVICKTLDPGNIRVQDDIRTVIDGWRHAKRISNQNEKELAAIERCLKHATDLDLACHIAYSGGKPIAFIIYEILSESTALLHYGKSSYGLPGAFDYIKIELAKYLEAKGVEFMNLEQDLGIEGLRADKNSYHPTDFLKKYTLRPRS